MMSRIPRHYPLWDDCNTSMNILYERIEKYFQEHHFHFKNRLYSDFYKGVDLCWESNEVVDVITFGDTIRKIFQSGNLVQSDLRFWNICEAFRKLQNDLIYNGQNIVNVIERESLFESQDSTNVDLSKPIDLIYAGRISRQKNIGMLIRFNEQLNREGIPSRLHLFGSYDNRYHEHLGRQRYSNYETELASLISKCRYKPQFYGRVGKNEWLERDYDQPIAVSLSTFIGEDFGVSLAQARERGWPVLCSYFGGHKDIRGNQIAHVPSFYCQGELLPEQMKNALIERAVMAFKDEGFRLHDPSIGPNYSLNLYETICLEEIDRYRRELAKTIGSSLYWLNLESMDNFADTQNGSLFIRKCLYYLESEGVEGEHVFVLSRNFSDSDNEFLREQLKKTSSSVKLYFLNEDEISFKDNLFLLKRASKVLGMPSVTMKTQKLLKELFP